MAFNITFDYRFDTAGFFTDPARRLALEEAGRIWESLIGDEFDPVSIGTTFTVRNPAGGARETITLTEAIDDVIIFVAGANLSGSTLGFGGPDGFDAEGDIFRSRIASDFRGTGPVTDFEPWAGTIAFDINNMWNFRIDAAQAGLNDFISVALHEIGHVLGIGTSATFESLTANNTFTGPNAQTANSGAPVPLEADNVHVVEGFANDQVLLDPILSNGTRTLPSAIDQAILADIGFEIDGFVTQGSTPPITTQGDDNPVLGSATADLIDGLAGNDQIQGGGGNDTLIGGAGNDTLFGGTGADTFEIQPGHGQNDLADFDLANEILRLRNSGFATVQEALGAISKPFTNVSRLTLADGTTADIFHDIMTGTPLEARHIELVTTPVGLNLVGGPGPELLQGAEGDDTITGGGGSDTISGGAGTDAVRFAFDLPGQENIARRGETLLVTDPATGAVTEVSGVETFEFSGPGGVPTVLLLDELVQRNVNDAPTGAVIITGSPTLGSLLTAGTDTIADADGLGTFTLQWLADGVEIDGATGTSFTPGPAQLGAAISVRLSYSDGFGTLETLTSLTTSAVILPNVFEGTGGSDVITGTDGPDTITAGAGNDTIDAGDGDDVIDGGIGFDVIDGGSGDDLVRGLNGFDTISGGVGNDTLQGNSGQDSLLGGDGDDVLLGGVQADTLEGGVGQDSLVGASGADLLDGGAGDDTLEGNFGFDTLLGGDGADVLDGGLANDRLEGGAGDDLLSGANGADLLLGGDGADRLEGNAGGDTLDGGLGDDVLRGGLGVDTFVFRAGSGNDRIVDFGIVDQVEIEAALVGDAPVPDDLRALASLNADGFLVLDFGGGDTLTFTGITNTGAILDDVSFV
jgi:Ca2+-binding RTX toxin-like protein